jgi:anti-sigma factor RsiW
MAHRDDTLQRYFDGALSESERAQVEATLDDDDRSVLSGLAAMRRALGAALDSEAQGIDLVPGVEAALARKRPPLPARSSRMRWIGTAVGAAVMAAALLLVPRSSAYSNACDIESLEVEGAVASVFSDGDATVLWTEETEEN